MKTPDTLKISAIDRSPTNPRKHFDEVKLQQLGDTIRSHGVLQKLLVRPWSGRPRVYELVDGERRWLAAKAVGLDEVPVNVRELSDGETLEIQAISGETSEPLTPIEQAEHYRRMLALRKEGKPNEPEYTVAKLAVKFGRHTSDIGRLLKILTLPESVREAVECGELGYTTAALIAAIPSAEMQLQAAIDVMPNATRLVPLTREQAEALINEKYTVSLAAAPFDEAAADLPGPKGTDQACTACEFRVVEPRHKKCVHPGCYRAKCNAVWDRSAAAAKAKGRTVLSDDEADKVFDANASGPEVRLDSPYVDINTKPTYRHVSNTVDDSKLPTWKALIAGAEDKGIVVPVVEARHRSGRRVELVRLEHAIEAAKKAGEDIFRKDDVGTVVRGTDDWVARKKEEAATVKRRHAESCLAIVELHDKLAAGPAKTGNDKLTAALLSIAMNHAGNDGLTLVAKAFELKTMGGCYQDADAIDKWFAQASSADRNALIPILLIAHDLKWNGLGSLEVSELAKLVSLDLKAVGVRAQTLLKNAKQGKNAREGDLEKRIADDPKIREEWTKEYCQGATVAEIAQQYKVPVADVQTVLGPGIGKSAAPKQRLGAGKKAEAAVRESMAKKRGAK